MHIYPKRASLEGQEIEIFKLVSYSATPEQWKEWLRVPLEHAAARGNLDLFNKIIEAGANGSAGWRGCRDRTLLDAAALGGNEDVVSGLLRAGAQPDVKVVSCSSKRSALYTATMLGHEAVARQLIVGGADVNFQDPVHKWSVLVEAIRGGHERLVNELLMNGVNPNRQDVIHSASPLHAATYKGLNEMVSTLLLRGADKDALDFYRHTPLMWASEEGHLPVVKTLLAAGVNVGIRGANSYSALDCAATEGHGEIVEAIAGQGADLNAGGGDDGYTALHFAAQFDRAGAVNALVQAGADIESKNVYELTPLLFGAGYSSCKSMLALLRHGAKVDVRDVDGDTPLHAACWGSSKGVEAAVDLLLRWGADETALNSDGASPAELLVVNDGNEDVDNPAMEDEIGHTRLLLSRAPADRAWRRRGWLVILHSRDSKAKAGEGGSDDKGGESEVARSENVAGIEYDGPRKTDNGAGGELGAEDGGGIIDDAAGQLGLELVGTVRTASGDDGCVVGAEAEEGGLRLEMLPLLGLGQEGVFRTVVSFL